MQEGRHVFFFLFSSRRRHTRLTCDWSSDVCSSDLGGSVRNLSDDHGAARTEPKPKKASIFIGTSDLVRLGEHMKNATTISVLALLIIPAIASGQDAAKPLPEGPSSQTISAGSRDSTVLGQREADPPLS